MMWSLDLKMACKYLQLPRIRGHDCLSMGKFLSSMGHLAFTVNLWIKQKDAAFSETAGLHKVAALPLWIHRHSEKPTSWSKGCPRFATDGAICWAPWLCGRRSFCRCKSRCLAAKCARAFWSWDSDFGSALGSSASDRASTAGSSSPWSIPAKMVLSPSMPFVWGPLKFGFDLRICRQWLILYARFLQSKNGIKSIIRLDRLRVCRRVDFLVAERLPTKRYATCLSRTSSVEHKQTLLTGLAIRNRKHHAGVFKHQAATGFLFIQNLQVSLNFEMFHWRIKLLYVLRKITKE